MKGGLLPVTVAVFTSSSEALAPSHYSAAEQLGGKLSLAGYAIVYGGGNNGLMGALARGAHSCGGTLIGVIPRALREAGFCFEQAGEIIVTETLAERKKIMTEKAAAFVCLPGGLGTLDELFSVLTEKQLGFHDKPIFLFNLNNFFEPISALLRNLKTAGFIPGSNPDLFRIINTDEELLHCLAQRA